MYCGCNDLEFVVWFLYLLVWACCLVVFSLGASGSLCVAGCITATSAELIWCLMSLLNTLFLITCVLLFASWISRTGFSPYGYSSLIFRLVLYVWCTMGVDYDNL